MLAHLHTSLKGSAGCQTPGVFGLEFLSRNYSALNCHGMIFVLYAGSLSHH